MKSYKGLAVLVIFVMLLNVGFLGFLWYGHYHPKQHNQVHQPVFEYISKELKLNPVQQKQYDAMRNEHFALTSKLNAEIRKKRDAFFDQLKDPKADPATINAMAKSISADEAMIDTATFYHFRRFRAILNATQQSRFDEIINDVLHAMAGPAQHGPPPQGPGGRFERMQPPSPDSNFRGNRRSPNGMTPGGPPPARRPDDTLRRHNGPPPNGDPDFRRPSPPGEGPPPPRIGPDGKPLPRPPYPPPPGSQGPPPDGPPPGK